MSRGDCVVGRREILYAMHFTRSKQGVEDFSPFPCCTHPSSVRNDRIIEYPISRSSVMSARLILYAPPKIDFPLSMHFPKSPGYLHF
jgi:hypothetical protein